MFLFKLVEKYVRINWKKNKVTFIKIIIIEYAEYTWICLNMPK